MPFAVGEKKETWLTFRPVFPLVSNPVYDSSEADGTDGRETGLGDIQVLTLAGPKTGNGLVWGCNPPEN